MTKVTQAPLDWSKVTPDNVAAQVRESIEVRGATVRDYTLAISEAAQACYAPRAPRGGQPPVGASVEEHLKLAMIAGAEASSVFSERLVTSMTPGTIDILAMQERLQEHNALTAAISNAGKTLHDRDRAIRDMIRHLR
jgi:hypothetical protein